MQNKGFVKVFAALLTLVCLFYLSFSVVTGYHAGKAEEHPQGSKHYMDSMLNKDVWLGIYSLKECRELEIGLGLDLKGGMYVIMEVSVPDIVKALAGNKEDEAFKAAMENARLATADGGDFLTAFIEEYHKVAPEGKLSSIFATYALKDKITQNSTDKEVEDVIRAEIKAAVDNSENVLRSRIDRFGVVQPNIQKIEGGMGRIMIELPGIKEPDRVRKLLQGSANLEFWETYSADEIQKDIMPAFEEIDRRFASRDSVSAPLLSLLKGVPGSLCTVAGVHYNDTAAVMRMLESDDAKMLLPRDLRFMWSVEANEYDSTKSHFELNAIRVTNRAGVAALAGDVIANASAAFDERNNPSVDMQMNVEGAKQWAALTKKNVHRAIAIVLDGYVYSAPTVQGEIPGGRSQITGNFTIEATQDLANVLRSGKMAAPVRIVQEEVVGPSLGQQSIEQGLISFIVAFILLMIYMCAIYGVIPGSVANMALLLNLFFTLGILASFQAALTMSGIAGIVLTLGVAVDANVLIYERAKEELAAGKNVRLALSDGYKNAFSAIFDSNITSIITGIILFNFGTGPIKGFATTLIIGLLCSFFTAVFVTRVVYEHFMNKGKWQNITFTTKFSRNLMKNTKVNFIGKAKKVGIVFAVLAVAMVASFVLRGLSQSIDFTGGRNFVVQFEKEVEPETVRDLLKKKIVDDNVQAIALGTDGRTIRVTTNYMIDNPSKDVDDQISQFLYDSFMEGGLLSEDLTIETFRDYENRTGGSIISSQKVGPSMADDIRNGAIVSVILALIAIFIYILIRFRNVAYSVGSIFALGVDVLMIIGCYSLLYGILPMSLEIDQTFIGAILTAIGYSINDKVVIFDRVREFSHLYPKRDKFDLFNTSLNTTLARTINTSVSTLVVLLCIFVLGGDSIRSFSFAMILGVVFGTLSSLFIAAPIAYSMLNKKK
ncbi:MAG: protein translocase subunit SecD [Bacteroidales bacterium]|nr:protein translocase subunit SecD [Bacteroidales bacterium]